MRAAPLGERERFSTGLSPEFGDQLDPISCVARLQVEVSDRANISDPPDRPAKCSINRLVLCLYLMPIYIGANVANPQSGLATGTHAPDVLLIEPEGGPPYPSLALERRTPAVLYSVKASIFQNTAYAASSCRRPIKMSPLCQLEMTLPRGLRSAWITVSSFLFFSPFES